MPKKPKPEDLLEMANALIEENRARDELYDRLDAMYDQVETREQPNTEDADYVQFVTMPYATNAVDVVADLASDMKLTLEIPAASDSKKDIEMADDQEKWVQAWLSKAERMKQQNFTRDLSWHAAARAQAVARTVFTESLVEKGKDKDGYEVKRVPVLFEPREPRYVYQRDGINGPEYVVERFTRTVADIRLHYPDALRGKDEDGNEYSASEEVEWTEYWDATYRCYWAAGEPMKAGKTRLNVVPHGYGVLPYAFGTARSTPRQAPEKHYRPLLAASETILKNLDTWFSVLCTAGWASVTNAWGLAAEDYGRDGGKELDLTPGAVNYWGKGDQLQAIQRGAMPADFFRLGDMLLQAFQMGTFPFAVYGMVSGNMAGYAISLLTSSGRRPLVPIWKAVQDCYEQAIYNALMVCREKVAPLVGDKIQLVVNMKGDKPAATSSRGRMYHRTLTIDASKISDDFDCTVTLSDPLPQDEASNVRLALEAMKGGLLSQETSLTKFKIVSDAMDEIDRIAAEGVYHQLAPLEAVKIAVDRGLVPDKSKLPPGWVVGPQGMLIPEAMAPKPPEPPPAPPQLGPGPGGPGPVDIAKMQQIAGMQQALPDLNTMAGTGPTAPNVAQGEIPMGMGVGSVGGPQ
jgi:hypothetical protein